MKSPTVKPRRERRRNEVKVWKWVYASIPLVWMLTVPCRSQMWSRYYLETRQWMIRWVCWGQGGHALLQVGNGEVWTRELGSSNCVWLFLVIDSVPDISKLKGPQYATIDTPPNNAIFDTLDPHTVATKSLILQLNAEAMAAQEIHNHINIPPEIVRLLQPNALTQPPESHANTAPMLLPLSLTPGTKMLIEDFCSQFSLSADILERSHM